MHAINNSICACTSFRTTFKTLVINVTCFAEEEGRRAGSLHGGGAGSVLMDMQVSEAPLMPSRLICLSPALCLLLEPSLAVSGPEQASYLHVKTSYAFRGVITQT